MNSEQLFKLFDQVDEDFRMLCIDAAGVGCYLYQQGYEEAGKKLVHTAIVAAGLETSLIPVLLDNLPQSLDALPVHVEIKNFMKKPL